MFGPAVSIAGSKRVVIHATFLDALNGSVEECVWQEVPELKEKEYTAIGARLWSKYA